MERLLVVCSANLVRSPVAEAALSAWISRSEVPELVVSSAGLTAVPGSSPPSALLQAVRPFFLSLHEHRATRVTRDSVRDSSLVLAMTEAQRESLQSLVPAGTGWIFTLREFARLAEAIPKLSELDGDLPALVRAAHRERPRQPRPRVPEDVEDAIGGTAKRYRECIEQVVGLVDRITARLS